MKVGFGELIWLAAAPATPAWNWLASIEVKPVTAVPRRKLRRLRQSG
jgi:hypothetical protein